MNRIYQGRVSRVQSLKPSAVGESPPKNHGSLSSHWDDVPGGNELLWHHHALFQDAVNYYLLALLALATPENPFLGQLRQRIARSGDPFQIWAPFSRRGRMRPGLASSIARSLRRAGETLGFDDVCVELLAGNEADAATRDAAVTALLEACNGAGAIQQQGRAYLPKFCDPTTAANFAGDPAMLRRELHQELLPSVLHDPNLTHESPALDEFDTYSIATPDTKRPVLAPERARERLHQAVALWRERHPDSVTEFERLAKLIDKLPADFSLPGYVGSSAKGEVQARLFALLLFRHVERSAFTLELLRAATRPRKSGKPSKAQATALENSPSATVADPIRVARGSRGFVFRAFTSLPLWNPADTPEPQWKEFDIAAFKYALTALNQIEEKTRERLAEAEVIVRRLAYMRGESKKFSGATDQDEPPPVIAGDPRIERLRALLETLRVTNAMTDGESAEYGLHPRTLRGFRELRKRWRRHLSPGECHSAVKEAKLREELREFQAENRETVGSVVLFEALLTPENWLIWHEPTAELAPAWSEARFGDDPLEALLEESRLEEQQLRLREPIQLTPADAVDSRRQYDFHAASKFSAQPRARCRHDPAACAFTTEIAVCRDGRWQIERARIVYTAPRFLRDSLRAEAGETDLAAARWLQPMMAALASPPALPQDLTDCPVCLMPDVTVSGERRVLLNFPVTLEPEALVEKLGRAQRWSGQFCGPTEAPFALRWPQDDWASGKEPGAWYHRSEGFKVLGVDLGTRDSGALAHLTVTAGNPAKPVHRFLGEGGGHRWFASLTGTAMIRLPGEDTRVFSRGCPTPEVERFGERGRLASPGETGQCERLITELGADPTQLLAADSRRFFPAQNDALLKALRRAQGLLARLQSWSWRLRSEAECARATDEIREQFHFDEAHTPGGRIADIDCRLAFQRELVTRSLVAIANRVVPLRDRNWIWQSRYDDTGCHVLVQTDPDSALPRKQIGGQRGLSTERIEQLEELRRRCQSLNRALLHVPGERPRLGRRTKGAELPDPCRALLEKIDHLRAQRVDQTAHAILAAALGVRLREPTLARDARRARDIHGEYQRFREPVDFIVIEDLSRYLSSQDRSRRENTRLMQWSHRQLVAKLRQLCETYGIPVLATPAAYSSRFCSRTGAAGFRAVEVGPDDRLGAPWCWSLQKLAAHESGERKLEPDRRAEAERIRALFDELDRLNTGRRDMGKPPRTLLAPQPGGPIFVPLSAAPAMQADLNAAINVALRGIAAPAQHDIHHRIRTERAGGKLKPRTTTKREKARWPGGGPALKLAAPIDASERTPNIFSDGGGIADFDRVEFQGVPGRFALSRGLWTGVKRRAWERIAELNAARIRKWRGGTDDIPM